MIPTIAVIFAPNAVAVKFAHRHPRKSAEGPTESEGRRDLTFAEMPCGHPQPSAASPLAPTVKWPKRVSSTCWRVARAPPRRAPGATMRNTDDIGIFTDRSRAGETPRETRPRPDGESRAHERHPGVHRTRFAPAVLATEGVHIGPIAQNQPRCRPAAVRLSRGPCAPVAQLDRALPSEGKGHKFESCRARHSPSNLQTPDFTRPVGHDGAFEHALRTLDADNERLQIRYFTGSIPPRRWPCPEACVRAHFAASSRSTPGPAIPSLAPASPRNAARNSRPHRSTSYSDTAASSASWRARLSSSGMASACAIALATDSAS